MWEYFFIGFTDFIFKGKLLVDFPSNFQQNDKAILNLFGVNYNSWRKYICTAPQKITRNQIMLYNSGSVELKKQKNTFIEETNERGNISKTINQYITVLEYRNLKFFENKEKNKTKTKKRFVVIRKNQT